MKIKNSQILLINLGLAIGTFIFLDRGYFLAAIFFVLWLVITSLLASRIIKKILPDWPVINFLLGIFVSLWLLGSVANVFCSWLALNNLTILLSFIATTMILVIGDLFGRPGTVKIAETEDDVGFKFSNWWLILLLAMLAGGFWTIVQAVSGGHLTSPWQVLPSWYGVIIFGVFLLTGFLAFSRRSRGLILLMVILASLLVHSYLLVYNNGFGADRWRHLGSEIRIAQNLEYQPTLLTNNLWLSKIGPLSVPRALVDGPKLSYGFEWSLALIGSKVLGQNLFSVDRFILPILWSVFLPLLMFVLAWGVWPRKQFAILAALASSSFYLLQYYGGQTLPASFGLLSFVLFLIFIIYYQNQKNKLALWCAVASLIAMYFGYSLAFILALIILIVVGFSRLRSPIKYVLMGLVSLSVFFVEWTAQAGVISVNHDFLAFWRDGNLVFFNWGKLLFGGWGGSSWLLLAINILVALIYILVGWFLYYKKYKEWKIIGWGIVLILINYVLSWQLLGGEHTLSRRLTLFVAPLLVLLVAWVVVTYGHKNKTTLVLTIIVFSLVSSLAYASGPVFNINVSDDDMATAKYIWLKINGQHQNYCVLASDSQTLPLEALSGKEMIAGNFPNGSNHQQTERLAALRLTINDPSTSTFRSILDTTQKANCFLVLDYGIIDQIKTDKISTFLGQPEISNNKYIWQFGDSIINK